jgi:hypothetical protein
MAELAFPARMLVTNSYNLSTMVFPLLLGSFLGSTIAQDVPSNALVVDRLALNNLETVQPVYVENLTTVSPEDRDCGVGNAKHWLRSSYRQG